MDLGILKSRLFCPSKLSIFIYVREIYVGLDNKCFPERVRDRAPFERSQRIPVSKLWKLNRFRLSSAQRSRFDSELGQNEVTFIAAAGTLLRQPLIDQGLEAKSIDVCGSGFSDNFIDAGVGSWPTGKDGLVR